MNRGNFTEITSTIKEPFRMKPWSYMLSFPLCLALCCSCGKQKESPAPQESASEAPRAAAAETETPKPVYAQKTLPGLEGGVLQLKNDPTVERTEKKLPEIEDRKNNIRTISGADQNLPLPGGGATSARNQKWDKSTPVPPHSLAAKLKRADGKRIQWAPQRVTGSIPGVRLPDAAISYDQSVLAFAELFGAESGPYGTRIILLNTHDWHILKIIEIKRKVKKITFAGDTVYLAALCAEQPALEQSGGLSLIRLDSGAEAYFAELPPPSEGDLGAGRSGCVFLADSQNSGIRYWKPGKPVKTGVIPTAAPAKLGFSPDGKILAAANGKGTIELFKMSDFRLLNTVRLPFSQEYPIHQVLFLNNAKDFLCAPDPLSDRSSFVYRASQIFELKGRSSGSNVITGDGLRILHLKKVNGEIEILESDTLQKITSFMPEHVKPDTHGDPAHVFYLDHARLTAVLDTGGTFYLLCQPKGASKFQKEIIFSPVD